MTKEEMKRLICEKIDASKSEIEALAADIESTPELGYKETKTAAKIEAYMRKLGLDPETGLALTGVKARVKGKTAGPTVAVIGELDAIGTPDSPKADPLTGAAHTCGHFLQTSAMLAAAQGLIQSGVMQELSGDAVFFAVPAEEYVEITYRQKLRKEGKLHYLCGKDELIYRGAFDDVDMAMMMHSRDHTPGKTVAIGQSSNGFVVKLVQYVGRSAHAANAPHEGIKDRKSVV